MPSKQKSRKIKQRLEQEEAASHLQVGFPSSSSGNSNNIEGLISSISLTIEDSKHFAAVQEALQTITKVKPALQEQRKIHDFSLIMERDVLEVPVAEVKEALAYYDKLKQELGSLNENHKVIVKMARRALMDLASLKRQQRLQKGVAVVEDPEEGECVVQ